MLNGNEHSCQKTCAMGCIPISDQGRFEAAIAGKLIR
jgi:hypothetical protein